MSIESDECKSLKVRVRGQAESPRAERETWEVRATEAWTEECVFKCLLEEYLDDRREAEDQTVQVTCLGKTLYDVRVVAICNIHCHAQ